MKANLNDRRREYKRAIIAAGINPETDFFVLSSSDLVILSDLARLFKYRRPANYPGSTARAFYYSAQAAK